MYRGQHVVTVECFWTKPFSGFPWHSLHGHVYLHLFQFILHFIFRLKLNWKLPTYIFLLKSLILLNLIYLFFVKYLKIFRYNTYKVQKRTQHLTLIDTQKLYQKFTFCNHHFMVVVFFFFKIAGDQILGIANSRGMLYPWGISL